MQTIPTQTLKDAALAYAEAGYKIFPCRPMDKVPLVSGGFHVASSDKAQVELWWKQWPEANIGLPTGAVNGLVVLDFDEKSGGLDTFEEMKATLPPASTVATGGGGLHLYFAHPGQEIRNKAGLQPGLDIRGDGGYVIAPPSVHSSGMEYTFTHEEAALTELPTALLAALSSSRTEQDRAEGGGSVLEGGRNAYLTRMAGVLARRGLSPEALLAALIAENEAKCMPSLPLREVEAIASWAATKAPAEDILMDTVNALENAPASLVVRASDLLDKTFSYLTDKEKVKGTPTGLTGLDRMLGGGFRLGEVTCWHAEAKTGKNTLWHMLMYMAIEAGIPQGYASRELTPEQEVIPNLLCLKTLENAWNADVAGARKEEWTKAILSWPLYFAEGYGMFSMDDIDRWMDELQRIGVWNFWFDHLHYMLEDPEDHKAASKLIKEIKTRAKQRQVHVNIIIQPNKLMDGQKLSLNSIKGGAAMGQAIDNLLIMERQKAAEGTGNERLNVSKLTLEVARSKLCKPGSIYLQYDPDITTFVEVEKDESAPEPARVVRPDGGAAYGGSRVIKPRM